MNAKRIWITIGALAVLTGGWLWTNREPEPSKGIRALQADPLASYVPKGTLRTERADRDARTALGKTSPIRITRWHVMREQDARAAWKELRALARKGGWRDSPFGRSNQREFSGQISQLIERTLSTGNEASGQLAIDRAIGLDPVPDGQLVVIVSMSSLADPPE